MSSTDEMIVWAIVCLFMAALPWIVLAMDEGLRRVSLAQIGLLLTLVAIGFAGPRMRIDLGLLLLLVLCGSLMIALMPQKS